MLTKNIKFKNFLIKSKKSKIKKILNLLFLEKNEILNSLSTKYEYSFSKKIIKKYKKNYNLRIIGMGGSTLGTEAIFSFLKHKIKKNVFFANNLVNKYLKFNKKIFLNLIVSKSGNTLETITNANILINKKDDNIFITENRDSYLRSMANQLKAEIIDHNNFIGGRYSVLSEVGMLPIELAGLNSKKFKQLNFLIKNKNFMNTLVQNVSNTLSLIKKKKYASVILNYDEKSENLFKWYQQLIAESLGKKSKGILPTISSMPKDNHSLMQMYLDGPKKNFYTFFYVFNSNSQKINNDKILSSFSYLKNKNIEKILYSQKLATERIFHKKKLPFRSFEVNKRDEKTLGELFCFFILETILLGKSLGVNPYDQPSVELIKKETKKILKKN
jgi:glucose-6-phosphate isomerase